MAKREDIVVFRLKGRESACSECGVELGRGQLLRKEGDRGLCMGCADLDELEFLPAGDAALTRRAAKYTGGRVVVVTWSQPRRRYERQGILVREEALARAETECLADADSRARRREREAIRRAYTDETDYDRILLDSCDRSFARREVADQVDDVLRLWSRAGPAPTHESE